MSYTPGQRISNRDEDFIIQKVIPNKKHHLLHVEGISELVKQQRFIFDTSIDKSIRILNPAETKLVADTESGYHKTKLYVENQIRNSTVYSDKITIAHKAAFNLTDFQLEPTLKSVQLPRPRILIADGVGLGKTIEVGIFLAEMIKRGKGKRILVIALKSILGQFQQEIWNRFAIPLVRLDSYGISKIKSELPVNKNPFEYYDKTIVSIDTLKNNERFQHYIEKTYWDIVVVDECHTVANSSSQRGGLAQLLSTRCESLVFTSATPHNGKMENFANLINMIEPLAIKDENDFTKKDIEPYYVRRFKKDIKSDEVKSNFQDREVISIHANLYKEEEDFLEVQQAIKFDALSKLGADEVKHDLFGRTSNRKLKRDLLFSIGLFKSYMSSPDAALMSINKRIEKVAAATTDDEEAIENNLDILGSLKDKLTHIVENKRDAKYDALRDELIRLKWNGRKGDFRIVVFAERIETLKKLKNRLQEDFNLDEKVIAEFNGSLSDIEQQSIIEDFGKEDSDFRILLTSDAGSQGVNLHYHCHHLFNYDLPWSLITLEQRNGRIDRYGQANTPFIHYLIAKSELKGLKDDLHILSKLAEKEDVVHKTLGDSASVFKLFDPQKEEVLVTKAIATRDASLIDGEIDDEDEESGFDFDALFGDDSTEPLDVEEPLEESISLFNSEKDYYQALINQLKIEKYINEDDVNFEGDLLEVKRTEEIDRILYDMPQEAKPSRMGDVYQLALDKNDVEESITKARRKKGEWAQFQVLYDLHPIIRFLMSQLEASVDKDVALVSKLSQVEKGRAYFLVHGTVSNNLGQALLSEFFVMPMQIGGGLIDTPIHFDDFIQRYKLNEELYTMQINDDEIKQLEDLLPDTIKFSDTMYMKEKQDKKQLEIEKDIAVYEEKMKNWHKSKHNMLEIEFQDAADTSFTKYRRDNKERKIETILDESSRYFENYKTLGNDAYLKVLAVFYNK